MKKESKILIGIIVLGIIVIVLVVNPWGSSNSSTPKSPDYSSPECWISLPDSIKKPVDVFFVIPTVYDQNNPKNMDIYNDSNRMDAESVFLSHKGVFDESANVFSPYYRQMCLEGLEYCGNRYENEYFLIGYGDVADAFDYYLKNLNGGRPFILAGHSQGTMDLIMLMRKKFDSASLLKKLVAAYLIGYSVTKQILRNVIG